MTTVSASGRRGQANLIALGAALLALTVATGVGLALAESALAGTERQPLDRAAAESASDRLVAADSPTTRRANVLDESAIRSLALADLEAMAPALRDRAVRVRLDDRSLLERGAPEGATVRRVVLVAAETTAARRIDLDESGRVTLPRRTERVRLSIDSGPNTTVVTARANDRVVLHDPNGLDGVTTVPVSRYDTTTISVESQSGRTTGSPNGTVELTYYPVRTTKAVLEVSVGG